MSKPSPALPTWANTDLDIIIVSDVTGKDEFCAYGFRKRQHPFGHRIVGIGKRDLGSFLFKSLGYGPGNALLVCHTENNRFFPR